KVLSSAKIKVAKHGYYFSDFSLTTGHVGKLNLDYSVEAEEHAVVELTSRVFGHAKDTINMTEKVSLNGRFSHSVIKSRVALEDEAKAVITGITEGCAEGARGHMDCLEIIKDNAEGQSIPVVKVTHPLAKITHEAAIGTIDSKQLETLIVHGLTPEQATDLIVLGILR
ncbi:MAG: FeS assembly protein SufBD, partial [Methylomarinum sp.]|nr:FeS assembly protein SufBD [Methylomarinum sp.]